MKNIKQLILLPIIFSIPLLIFSCSNNLDKKIIGDNNSKSQSWNTLTGTSVKQDILSNSWWEISWSWIKLKSVSVLKLNTNNTWNILSQSTKDNISSSTKKPWCTLTYNLLVNADVMSKFSGDTWIDKLSWKRINYLLNLTGKGCNGTKKLQLWIENGLIILPSWTKVYLAPISWFPNILWKKEYLWNETFKNIYWDSSIITAYTSQQLYDTNYILYWKVWNLWFITKTDDINKDNWQIVYNELREVMNNTKEIKSITLSFNYWKIKDTKFSLKKNSISLFDSQGLLKEIIVKWIKLSDITIWPDDLYFDKYDIKTNSIIWEFSKQEGWIWASVIYSTNLNWITKEIWNKTWDESWN